jgi:hypothetical protein
MIPANTELKLRVRWVVRNSGQIDKFLAHQKLTWTVYASDGNVRATRVPSPEYGDLSYWSAPVHNTTADFTGDGVPDDVWYSDYLATTGAVLAAGETVRVAYTLTADVKTDDGFRGFPGSGPWNAFQTIASGSNCTVTGVV